LRKVNLTLQVILFLLPFIQLIAYARIKKLQRGMLNNLIGGIIGSAILYGPIGLWVFFGPEGDAPEILGYFSVYGGILGWYIVSEILGVKGIRKWSKEWNEQVERENG